MNSVKDYKLVLAIITIAVVWGTTYLTIRIAVETIPPWFVTGIRQSLAAVLVMIILLYKRQLEWIGKKRFTNQIIISTLMLIVANGFTTIAERYVTSSLTSVLAATTPIVVFLGSVGLKLEKFKLQSVVGLILGFSGILLIFWNGLQDLVNPDYRFGIFMICIAIIGWASGILFSKKIMINTDNPLLNLFYQFAFAGIVQLIFAFLFSEDYNFGNWSVRSISSVIYLGVFGSVITFSAFLYALKRVNPSQISMLNYVNTIIAVFLGWLVLNEEITTKFIIATALIICGVIVINYKPGMFRRKKADQLIPK